MPSDHRMQRKREFESCPRSLAAILQRECAAMRLDDAPGQRQPDTAAAGLRAEERHEQVLDVRHAVSVSMIRMRTPSTGPRGCNRVVRRHVT